MNYITKEGSFDSGESYSILGRPTNGPAYEYDEDIIVAGEDVALVLPQYGVVGVFDGAGGTRNLGSPLEAALTAARRVRAEYHEQRGNVSAQEVLQFADAAVVANPEASVCMGALVRVCQGCIEAAQAGTNGVLSYDPLTCSSEVYLPQQINTTYSAGDPLNYLGRQQGHIPSKTEANIEYNGDDTVLNAGSELYIATDGVLGNWTRGEEFEDYSLEAAHGDLVQLQYAREYDAPFVQNIRDRLRFDEGDQLRRAQLDGYEEIISPELIKPSLFTGEGFDWSVWSDIVQPYIAERLNPPEQTLSKQAILRSIVSPAIRWPHESWKDDDDAMIAMITRP